MSKRRENLEGRFIKRHLAGRFIGFLNTSEGLASMISTALSDSLMDIVRFAHELSITEKWKNPAQFLVELSSDEAEDAVLAGLNQDSIARALYNRSRFLDDIKGAVVSVFVNTDGTETGTTLRLYLEEGVVGQAATIAPDMLDTFNQYILLHFMPYIRSQLEAIIKDDHYRKVHLELHEVVEDKVAALMEIINNGETRSEKLENEA